MLTLLLIILIVAVVLGGVGWGRSHVPPGSSRNRRRSTTFNSLYFTTNIPMRMRWISHALGYQPDPTPEECICAECGVNCCGWRNSIRLIDGQRVTVCETCGERAATHARLMARCDAVLARRGNAAAVMPPIEERTPA